MTYTPFELQLDTDDILVNSPFTVTYDSPWPHYITDNLFTDSEYQKLREISDFFKSEGFTADSDERWNLNLSDFAFYEETDRDSVRGKGRLMEAILEGTITSRLINTGEIPLAPERESFYSEFTVCGDGYAENPHNGQVGKLQTHAVYMSDSGIGTLMWDSTGEVLLKTVDWRPGRVVSWNNRSKYKYSYSSNVAGEVTLFSFFANGPLHDMLTNGTPAANPPSNLTLIRQDSDSA